MSGRFIVFEGGEGAGKSTQSRMLSVTLQKRGVDVVATREPGGTPGAETIRSLLLDPAGPGWGPRAEALLFAAARADHVDRLIAPALAQGKWVICDRYLDSSRAYQGGGSGVSDADLLDLHRIGSQGLLPDLTILLVADEAEVARRLAARDGTESDAIGGRSSEYHARVNAAFLRLAEAEPQRFVVIDAVDSPEDIHTRILAAVDAMALSQAPR